MDFSISRGLEHGKLYELRPLKHLPETRLHERYLPACCPVICLSYLQLGFDLTFIFGQGPIGPDPTGYHVGFTRRSPKRADSLSLPLSNQFLQHMLAAYPISVENWEIPRSPGNGEYEYVGQTTRKTFSRANHIYEMNPSPGYASLSLIASG
ncbi:hypothetical protein F4776DRAFT_325064 [Hypoxylon sp. NC0597]|nr:hypothetical protein F4776DRAFT_325064 [Hypoxylon sp. NC0597]